MITRFPQCSKVVFSLLVENQASTAISTAHSIKGQWWIFLYVSGCSVQYSPGGSDGSVGAGSFLQTPPALMKSAARVSSDTSYHSFRLIVQIPTRGWQKTCIILLLWVQVA